MSDLRDVETKLLDELLHEVAMVDMGLAEEGQPMPAHTKLHLEHIREQVKRFEGKTYIGHPGPHGHKLIP